jgi:hypothetical protein
MVLIARNAISMPNFQGQWAEQTICQANKKPLHAGA